MMNILLLIALGLILFRMFIQEKRVERILDMQIRQLKRIERLEEKRLDYNNLKNRIEKVDEAMRLINEIEKAKNIKVEVKELYQPIGFNMSNKTVGEMIEQVDNTYRDNGIDLRYEDVIMRI